MTAKATRKKAAGQDPLPDWVPVFLVGLRVTGNVKLAAQQAGVERSTAYRLKEKSERFRAMWVDAHDDALDDIEAALRTRALTTSDTAAIFLLKCHRKEIYGESPPVNNFHLHTNEKPAEELTDEQLARIAEQAEPVRRGKRTAPPAEGEKQPA